VQEIQTTDQADPEHPTQHEGNPTIEEMVFPEATVEDGGAGCNTMCL
jgi:hypothetical protein